MTAEVKKTLLRPKPKGEWVEFKVPALVSEELWQVANAYIAQRGRGRGKQGKTIEALFRNRIHCPRCGSPMVVRRAGHLNGVYYYCSRYCRAWAENPCNYSRFIPGRWDQLIWQDICSWLRTDVLVEQQLSSEQLQNESLEKLVRMQQLKISQVEAKIARVQEGFEGELYSLYDAKRRIDEYRETSAKAEREIHRLRERINNSTSGTIDLEALREELKVLRDRNLDAASFEEKLDIVSKLGIAVCPSEDLQSMRVLCRLNLGQAEADSQIRSQVDRERELATRCRKVRNGSAYGICWQMSKTVILHSN